MLRIPKRGTFVLDKSPSFSGESCAGQQQDGADLLCFRGAVLRGILSAAMVATFLILFLL